MANKLTEGGTESEASVEQSVGRGKSESNYELSCDALPFMPNAGESRKLGKIAGYSAHDP